jgi:hypothetical protein
MYNALQFDQLHFHEDELRARLRHQAPWSQERTRTSARRARWPRPRR